MTGVLIEVEELAAAMESGMAPVLLDVRWNLSGPPGRAEFEEAHIPFAQWVDLETELAGPAGAGGRHPLPDPDVFGAAMQRHGVSADSSVVVCDGATSMAAARLWWLLTDAGHRDVRVLNGGVAAWQAAGMPVVPGPAEPAPPGGFVPQPGQRHSVSAEEVAALVGADAEDGPVLVDVRAAERYRGAEEPIDPVAGHIPGAVNLPTTDLQSNDGRFLPPAQLAVRIRDLALGDGPIVYCGSGVSATQSLLALEVASQRDGVLFPGSWSAWIADPERPVATGPHPH